MSDPALQPNLANEIKALTDRLDRVERASRMPPIAIDSWGSASTYTRMTISGTAWIGRKIVIAPPYSVLQAECHIQTDADTSVDVWIRENYSSPVVDTAHAVVPANSLGLVRFTWEHPFKVGWEGEPLDLLMYVQRNSGTGNAYVYPPWLMTWGGSSYLDGESNGKPEFIGDTLPPKPPPPPPPKPPPTVRTSQFGVTAAGAWRPQGGWAKNTPWQGRSSTGQWGPYTGIACYNAGAIRADLSGRTVKSAALYVHRLDGTGIHGAQALYVGWHAYTSIPGGQPAVGGLRHVGSLAVNQAAWLPIGVDIINAIKAGQNGLGCYGGGYMATYNWTLQITSQG